MRFYVSLFPDGEIRQLQRFPDGGPAPAGTVQRGVFSVAGQSVMCTDSYVKHAFGFTPSMSLFVECGSAAEIDRLAGALSADGQVLMPLGSYGFSRRFAWVNDRFGVSWQLNLA